MVTMNDVIAFVEKAIDKRIYIYTCEYFGSEIDITIRHKVKDDSYMEFLLYSENTLAVISLNGRFEIKNLTEKEVLEFKILAEKCKEYKKVRGLEDFNTFFKEDNKLTTINDLDNEDE